MKVGSEAGKVMQVSEQCTGDKGAVCISSGLKCCHFALFSVCFRNVGNEPRNTGAL